MKNILLFTIFLSTCFLKCYSQNWLWAKSANGVGEASSVCTDASGNVFVAGSFGNSIIFGSDTLTNSGSSGIFITKYDSGGNVIWAKNIGGQRGSSLSVCADGNIFVTGWFECPTITIGSTTLINAGGFNPGSSGGPGSPCTDMFIAKCDANGNVLWAKSAGGTGNEVARSVSADVNGNVFVTGYFASPSIIFGSITLTNNGSSAFYNNIYITKFDANGNVLWAQSATGFESTSVSTDAGGNVFVTGDFWDGITFGSITLTDSGDLNMFIVKYDANGNVVWAEKKPHAGGSSLTTDVAGNVFVTGWYTPPITFGSTTLNSHGPFIAKYDPYGNVLWAKGAIGRGSYYNFVSADANENAFITGPFEGPNIIFDSDTLYVPKGSDAPIYIVKYEKNGNVLCASTLASGGYYYSPVTADSYGNAYVVGGFRINPFIVGTDTLVPTTGGESIFAVKYLCSGNGTTTIHELRNQENMSVYPNPSSGIFTVNLRDRQETKVNVHDILGNCLWNKNCRNDAGTVIDLTGQSKGMYFLEIVSEGERVVKKIVLE